MGKEMASFVCLACMAVAAILIRIARNMGPSAVGRVLTIISWTLLIPAFFLMVYVIF